MISARSAGCSRGWPSALNFERAMKRGAGYVLHRALSEGGYACEVIAPSLIPKRPGVQRKHDKRDAIELARLPAPRMSWLRTNPILAAPALLRRS